jgi:hypothetical protein
MPKSALRLTDKKGPCTVSVHGQEESKVSMKGLGLFDLSVEDG